MSAGAGSGEGADSGQGAVPEQSAEQTPGPYGAPGSPSVIEAAERVTVGVRAEGFPTEHLAVLFDGVFSRLFPALARVGVNPAGPAHALYTSLPGETVDIEVGIPVDRVLGGEIDLGAVDVPGAGEAQLVAVASALPGGRLGAATHLGGFDGLGEAWGTFLETLGSRGAAPAMPFWEVYVTEPSPDMDPADLRTDLFTALRG